MIRRLLLPITILSLLAGCSSAPWHKAPNIQTQYVVQESIPPQQLPIQEEIPTQVTEKPLVEENTSVKQIQKPSNINKTEPIKKDPLETPSPKIKKEQKIIINEEGRLAHPYFYAKPANNIKAEKPKWFGENLKFKISWSFITAGEANLITSKIVEADAQYAYMIEAYAQSYSVIDTLFKVRDINASWVSLDGKRSLGYWQSVREGKYARDEWLTFDYTDASYTINKQDRHGKITQTENTFKGDSVFDMLSALYYVRMQPLPLKGELFFDIVNRSAQYPLKVIVHGRETVKVKAGKFDCIVVEPMISGEGIFVSKGKSLKVWLTDDEYKMPVKMSVEVFIGSVKAELVSYSRDEAAI